MYSLATIVCEARRSVEVINAADAQRILRLIINYGVMQKQSFETLINKTADESYQAALMRYLQNLNLETLLRGLSASGMANPDEFHPAVKVLDRRRIFEKFNDFNVLITTMNQVIANAVASDKIGSADAGAGGAGASAGEGDFDSDSTKTSPEPLLIAVAVPVPAPAPVPVSFGALPEVSESGLVVPVPIPFADTVSLAGSPLDHGDFEAKEPAPMREVSAAAGGAGATPFLDGAPTRLFFNATHEALMAQSDFYHALQVAKNSLRDSSADKAKQALYTTLQVLIARVFLANSATQQAIAIDHMVRSLQEMEGYLPNALVALVRNICSLKRHRDELIAYIAKERAWWQTLGQEGRIKVKNEFTQKLLMEDDLILLNLILGSVEEVKKMPGIFAASADSKKLSEARSGLFSTVFADKELEDVSLRNLVALQEFSGRSGIPLPLDVVLNDGLLSVQAEYKTLVGGVAAGAGAR